MYVTSETLAWFDSALLATEHLEQSSEDHRGVTQIITEFVHNRFKTQTLSDCSLNSNSVHTTFEEFYSGRTRHSKAGAAVEPPEIGGHAERLSCPIDPNREPFAHVVSAAGTYAVVTNNIPQHLYVFDEESNIPISRLKLSTDKTPSVEMQSVEEECFIDEQDIVSAIYLDPRGNFCIVRWRSGKAVYYYIPRRHHEAYSADDIMMHHKREEITKKEKGRVNQASGESQEEYKEDLMPRRYPLHFRPSVTGGRQAFVLECVAWDPHNKSDVTSGDIILGSSMGGVLLVCRLEKHGVLASRRLYQFPPPYRNHPIDSVAYTLVSHSPDLQQRHVVLVAQKSRLFVFDTPWTRRFSLLEAAFDTDGMKYHDVTPFHPSSFSTSASPYSLSYSASSSFSLGKCTTAGDTTDGGLFNYISVSGEVTDAASHSPGCCHRTLSSTASQTDGVGMRGVGDVSSSRLLSQVVIVEPNELLPNKTRATQTRAAETKEDGTNANGDDVESAPAFGADELPPVFFWQCGNTLTHGILILTDGSIAVEEGRYKKSTTTTTAATTTATSTSNSSMGNYTDTRFLSVQQPPCSMSFAGNKLIPLNENSPKKFLPIGILSVVNIFQCLQAFLGLIQEPARCWRSSAFSLPPAIAVRSGGFHAPQSDRINLVGIERPYLSTYSINDGNDKLKSAGLNINAVGIEPYRSHRDGQNLKGEMNDEKFVSFSAGYGHFVLTTTHAVYGFCHLAALSFPQKALEWKNRLVFSQKFFSGKMGHTTTGDRDAMTMAISSHDTGRSQSFHVFTKSSVQIVRLRHRRRRSTQYIVQLLDTASPVPDAPAKGDAADTPEGFCRESVDRTRSSSPLMSMVGGMRSTEAHQLNSPESTVWRSPLSSSPEDPLVSSENCFRLKFLENSTTLSNDSGLLLPESRDMHQGYNSNVSFFEDFTKFHVSKPVVLSRGGTWGGHLESGFRNMTHYDTDNLFIMALRFAALSPSLEERRELLPKVRHIYATYLFHQSRFLEAAAQHGLAYDGPPYFNTLLVRFSQVAADEIEPLILLLLLRLRGYDQHGRGAGSHSIEVCCLATWLISLLLERCNQVTKEEEEKDESVIGIPTPTSNTMSLPHTTEGNNNLRVRSLKMMAYLRRRYNLRNPQYLIEQIFLRYRTFLEWKGIRAATLGIANTELSFELCSRLGRDEEVLPRLLLQQERPLEGLVRLEQLSTRTIVGGGLTSTTAATNAVETGMESKTCCSVRLLKSYWTRYARFLMRLYPCRFVRRGLIPFGAELGINPVELIPALLLYHPQHNETVLEADAVAEVVLQRHAIEESLLAEERSQAPYHATRLYLEHVIYTEGHGEEFLLQLLLYFIARDGDDAAISRFFRELRGKNEAHRLEVSYAYRVCSRFQRPMGSAWVASIMGRHREAVERAILLQNEDLAIHFVQSIKGDDVDGVRHALWNEVAKTISSTRGGSQRALRLVTASNGDLNVSDVLPYLCGDVMMREFQDELLSRVSSFGETLEGIKQNILTSVKDVGLLQCDMEAIQQHPITLPSSQRCIACGQAALTRPFVVFKGCRHAYHRTCFNAQRATMEELAQQQQRQQLRGNQELCKSFTPSMPSKKVNEECTLRAEDELECVLCSTRYLRLLLTNPLSKNLTGSLPRLP